MKPIYKIVGLIVILAAVWLPAHATHNRGGEISYKHISGFLYEFTVVTYTKFPSPADRPSLPILWGDNTTDTIYRVAQSTLSTQPAVQKNTYTARHNYSGAGNFTISIEDPNRNGSVINLPNSLNTPFYIETQLFINPFLTPNNSVVLLNPPIDNGCTNKLFVHNPNAYDPDGDSISYILVPCKGQGGLPVAGFSYPIASVSFGLDAASGDLIWDAPLLIGEYNIAIKIQEWRQGVMVGSVVRDLQIDIQNCTNNPPTIQPTYDTCVMAGSPLLINIVATDPDNDKITLTANGAPFEATNPATFTQNTNANGQATATFAWIPTCNQIRKQPYQVVFRAKDTNVPSLVDLQTWRIKVVAPPPVLISATSQGGKITLNWLPYTCNTPTLRGYKIYRKQGTTPNISTTKCQIGLPPNTGFVLIDTIMRPNATTYTDDNNGAGLASGATYCYVITAFFATQDFFVLDGTESPPSNTLCNNVRRDMPTITHATVQATSPTQGKNKIQWLPPTQIDTAQYPAPYTLEIYRTPALDANTTTRTSIANYFYTDFYKIKPDFLIDSNINTQNNPNSYQIEFYYGANTQKVGIAKSSSTPYLTATPASTQIKLTWNYNTAWTNDTFVVYKKNAANNFDSLTTIINKNTYTDTDLTNGTNYCYYIKTKGNLNLTDTDKLYTQNLSQQTCATPIDQEPPPPPTLTITPNCNDIQNILTWTTTASPDLASFTIYYKPNLSAAFGIIASGLSPTDRRFAHTLTAQNSVVGCYILIAIDSTGNPSAAVDTVCIEECADNYKLPDIFTPNNDNINDVFVPFDGYKFVKNVDFVVYNRWGQPLYATQNPAINWTGNNTPAGIYYYKCLITINALSGTKQRQLTGNIKIVR